MHTALANYKQAEEYYRDEYSRADEDRSFVLGKQWPEVIERKRQKAGKPCLTENRLLPFLNKVTNDFKQSRPSIAVSPVDSVADVKTAEILKGVIRNIENVSKADTVYGMACYNANSGGYGYVRIITEYSSYDSFDQEIRLERVLNPSSVMLDPSSRRADASDARWGFVTEEMDKDEFKETYPDVDAEPHDGVSDGWYGDNTIRIVEYFYKDYEEKTLVHYRGDDGELHTGFEEDVTPKDEILKKRATKVCKVKYARIIGNQVIEENEFPSNFIPVVPAFGFETWLGKRKKCFSVIHQAKDPQRMLNYWKSAETEIIALQPKAPYIGALGQFKTYPERWSTANDENHPFLEYDMVIDPKTGAIAPPPQRQSPMVNTGNMSAEIQQNAEGIKASLGLYDASLGANSPDISGVAINQRQLQGDNSTYHFLDNISTCIEQVGRILVDMIPRIYSGERIVRIIGDDGKERMMPVNQPVIKSETGDYEPAGGQQMDAYYDLGLGKYDVVVEVGPSYATRRQEMSRRMVEIATGYPKLLEVAGDLIIEQMDFPDAQVIAKRLRATMPDELLGDDIEAQRLQQMSLMIKELQEKLQATEQALLAKDDNTAFKNKLELIKLENDRHQIEIKAAETQAKIAKMQAETKETNVDTMTVVVDAIAEIQEKYKDLEEFAEEVLNNAERNAIDKPIVQENNKGDE